MKLAELKVAHDAAPSMAVEELKCRPKLDQHPGQQKHQDT
jgi:hypothetical protein